MILTILFGRNFVVWCDLFAKQKIISTVIYNCIVKIKMTNVIFDINGHYVYTGLGLVYSENIYMPFWPN